MIYKIEDDKYVKLSDKEMKGYVETLKSVFPGILPENGGESLLVGIDSAPNYKRKQVIFRAGVKDEALGARDAIMPARIVPSIAKKLDPKTGMRTEYGWFERAPIKGRKSSQKGFRVQAPDSINPRTQLENLVWLYFFSDSFVNGNESFPGAYFQFIKVHEIAKKRMEVLQSEDEAKRLVINVATRVNYEDLRKLAQLMNIPLSGVEDNDRVTMYESISTPDKLAIFKAHADKTVVARKETLDLSEISAKVKAAIKRKVVAVKENTWVLQSEKGDTIIALAVVKGTTDDEKLIELCNELFSQPEKVENINAILNQL